MDLDYATLRAEGIRQLERLAGPQWTDFNEHDPGITILEQLCYALTDLLYRVGYDLPDILNRSGEETYAGLYGPERILTSQPLTLLDLRKVVLDVQGVKNAWVERVTSPSLPLLYLEHPSVDQVALASASDEVKGGEPGRLIQSQSTPGAEPVRLKGLYRVLIEKSDLLDRDSTRIIRDVARRLHACRGLCTDFQSVEVLATQGIRIQASVEIEPGADAETTYLAILAKMDGYISPPIAFDSPGRRLAAGERIEDVFEGPLLGRGVIDDESLAALERRTALRTSELIREVMDVAGVRMVDFLAFDTEAGLRQWSLDLDPSRTPRLDLAGTGLRLQRKGLPLQLDPAAMLARYRALQTAAASAPQAVVAPAAAPAPGRDRQIDRYHSVMYQFPAIYGVGLAALPGSASRLRQAQARQLQAYLLLFDQLLADGFAQVAHLRDLFGLDGSQARTYFAGRVRAPGLDGIWVTAEAEARAARLEALVDNPDPSVPIAGDWSRRHRFLDHLLARFADPFTDDALFDRTAAQALAEAKAALLRRYPEVSGARGTAPDVSRPAGGQDYAGFAERLQLKLGIPRRPAGAPMASDERFYLIEHILLRPTDGDSGQLSPYLAEARAPDPYSLQLSLVFPAEPARFRTGTGFRTLAEQVVREEAPAHLVVWVDWLERDAMQVFESAYEDWRSLQSAARQLTDQLGLSQVPGPSTLIRLRDARDRLIEILGIGRPYPIQDLPIADSVTVPFGTTAKIDIQESQRGVQYRLCDLKGDPLPSAAALDGKGGLLTLETPPVSTDTAFRIQAIRGPLTVLLTGLVSVKVGLAKSLVAQVVDAELLEPAKSRPGPTDPRLLDYGASARVEIQGTQEGVDYALVDAQGAELSADSVRGNLKSIVVESRPLTDDLDVRIRATKTFAPAENRATESELLDAVLPVKVRANPGLSVSASSVILDDRADTRIKVAASQASARYSLFAGAILDSAYVRGTAEPTDVAVEVPGRPVVRVRQPPPAVTWETPAGFTAVGGAQPGTGAELVFDLKGLTADQLALIRAEKDHETPDKRRVTSAVRLEQGAAVLVRPDPNPPLLLQAAVADDALQAPISVTGGQPGVFYHFRLAGQTADLAPPLYFHRKSPDDPMQNEGVGALQLEIDFAVAADPRSPRTGSSPATLAPEPPELTPAKPLTTEETLSILAVKAQTGLEVSFERGVKDMLRPPDPSATSG